MRWRTFSWASSARSSGISKHRLLLVDGGAAEGGELYSLQSVGFWLLRVARPRMPGEELLNGEECLGCLVEPDTSEIIGHQDLTAMRGSLELLDVTRDELTIAGYRSSIGSGRQRRGRAISGRWASGRVRRRHGRASANPAGG